MTRPTDGRASRFCLVLDARKSGLSVKSDVKARDLKKYGGVLHWRSYKKHEFDDGGSKVWKRSAKLGSFIVSDIG